MPRDHIRWKARRSWLSGQRPEQPRVDAISIAGGLQEWEPPRLNIPLLGYHQVENAATAYAALQVFRRERALPVSESRHPRVCAGVFWPGRFEILQRDPPVVVDWAHNRDSRPSSCAWRSTITSPNTKVVMIFGASEDKDVEGMFDELLPRVSG